MLAAKRPQVFSAFPALAPSASTFPPSSAVPARTGEVREIAAEIEERSRRSAECHAAFAFASVEHAARAAEELAVRSGGFASVSPSAHGGALVDVRCAPADVEDVVRVALDRGGVYGGGSPRSEVRHSDPCAASGVYAPPARLSAEIAQELAAIDPAIDYAYTPEGKLAIAIGGLRLTVDASSDASDAASTIDAIERFILLTRRLLRIVD
jgi:hypothetical protein